MSLVDQAGHENEVEEAEKGKKHEAAGERPGGAYRTDRKFALPEP